MPDAASAQLRLCRAWEWVLAMDRFVRIHYMSFSALWPLLGATTVRGVTGGTLAALLGVTFCFHAYAMLFNDVVDLPIDRTQPRRQRDPLVRGAIKPWQVLTVALVQPALAVLLTMSFPVSIPAHATLGAAFALMGAYNLWGKRCRFPPLTDAMQAFAWASLAVYGALVSGDQPNAMTWMVAAYGALFTLLVNGIHGPLRDLENDFVSGARTTAIFLGARPVRSSDPVVPPAVGIFDAAVRAGLIGVLGLLVLRNDFGYRLVPWTVTAVTVGAMSAAIAMLHNKVVHPRRPEWEVAFRLDVFLLTTSLPVAFVAYAGTNVLVVLLLLHGIALALFSTTPAVARWAWLSIVAAGRATTGKSLATGISRAE
jgi:4-hydroxybenzoate polyprenyltransferase